ncbi:endonuclease V [Nonlabens dokdonensis]|uniref:Endonuclease V n=2 Tax=Nonlabens dokdonensis TaxID=328515 RepID=L7W6K3_NONDD|nr:endonuclease V [Nonlabens dokdonensis]AGC75416.1 endonuclease V [Nonlabens dokdonensis DSW-6]PZX43115.1 endonuclease V [Nonlabens dokdonensis]
MILAFDTFYFNDKARTIAIQFDDWEDEEETLVHEELYTGIQEYVPGAFYKRELPCILDLLKKINLQDCEAIIIDGFVILDDQDKLGLGGYLYESLDKQIPLIGVGKNNFVPIKHNKRLVYRGESKKPLYITALGIDLDVAADFIHKMHGDYRMPDLLKKADSLGRH